MSEEFVCGDRVHVNYPLGGGDCLEGDGTVLGFSSELVIVGRILIVVMETGLPRKDYPWRAICVPERNLKRFTVEKGRKT